MMLFLLAAVSLSAASPALSALESDFGPVRSYSNGVVYSQNVPEASIKIDESLSYAGRMDFSLYGVADVQRFHFVDTDENGAAKRLLVVQFEQYKDSNEYTYNTDKSLGYWQDVGGLEFKTYASVRDVAGTVERWKGVGIEYAFQTAFFDTLGIEQAGPQALLSWSHYLPSARQEMIVLYYEPLEALGLSVETLELSEEDLTGRGVFKFPDAVFTGVADPSQPSVSEAAAKAVAGFWKRGESTFEIVSHD